MFTGEHLGQILLAGLIVGILFAIGFVLLIIPGLIVLFYRSSRIGSSWSAGSPRSTRSRAQA